MRNGGYAGMRCKLHPCVPGSVGVCASCLRERLLDLLAAQAREAESTADDRRKPDQPPPLIFPRSVSPYVCRQSVHDDHHHLQHDLLFYSTPQVGPTFPASQRGGKKHRRFSLFRSLFRSSSRFDSAGSGQIDRDPRVSRASNASSSSNSSSSWFSALLPLSRTKKSRLFSLDEDMSGAGGRRSWTVRDRGMSPSAERKGNRYGEEGDESPFGSGYSSESSSAGYRKSGPVTGTPLQRRRGGALYSRNVSGLAFCLSPLVSHHHRLETGSSGELRGTNRHHLVTAASLSSNRSRKLVDFGRYP